MAGMVPTDMAHKDLATAMETKNPVGVIFKGPLRYRTKEYLTFSEPYKTAKYVMLQRNINSWALMELAEVKVLGETCILHDNDDDDDDDDDDNDDDDNDDNDDD